MLSSFNTCNQFEESAEQYGMFFTPFKNRTVVPQQMVDVYRNLHTNNGYSIRCSKSGLVLSHCSTVKLRNARFIVSKSGRQKTIQEKRKRVHAYIRGELVGINELVPDDFLQVHYNPYHTPLFTIAESDKPVYEAEEVICCGKYAYVKQQKQMTLFDL
ncbi:hypothetical protein [Cytobacillus firmus]|uniref:Uncharacterized protein n=1 Tax=Cytobacillus firmus DS1 TaxID=1307436 RepID=W7L2J0_CYTFI|nr:hypothetical protein [Cytobacillus firmus]EWG09342.1 hypothetical protein PBF_19638 [Cytobacillus firmus DS1]